MNEILVIGHKNLDTDSVRAAHCYAELKNQMGDKCRYTPLRCGGINKQTAFIFDTIGSTPPEMRKDITSDFKIYKGIDYSVGIVQVEATNLIKQIKYFIFTNYITNISFILIYTKTIKRDI